MVNNIIPLKQSIRFGNKKSYDFIKNNEEEVFGLNVYDAEKINIRIHHEFNEYPDVIQYDDINPTLYSPNADFELQFAMTKASLYDVDLYKRFIDNSVSRFRSSKEYKKIKSDIESMGLNKCQVFGYIDDEMAKVEMHHNIIGIKEIAIMITEHIINTIGCITTFDLITLLIKEHEEHNVPLVMLSELAHEMHHSMPNAHIPQSMTFGKWWDLIYKYRRGITYDIANKIYQWVGLEINEEEDLYKDFWVKLRDDVKDWSVFNEYGMDLSTGIDIGVNEANYEMDGFEIRTFES